MGVQRNEQGLLEYQGMVVPWLTRWTGEPVPDQQPVMDHHGRVFYPDERPDEREADNVLWMREGITRLGEPEFSQVNVFRHRASMRRALCQVCGKGIHQDVINWLIPFVALQEDGINDTPPTCDNCIPVALALCPHLREYDWSVVKVLDYALWGVRAQQWRRHPETGETEQQKVLAAYFQTSREVFGSMIAVQQVVQFTKFVVGGINDLPQHIQDAIVVSNA